VVAITRADHAVGPAEDGGTVRVLVLGGLRKLRVWQRRASSEIRQNLFDFPSVK